MTKVALVRRTHHEKKYRGTTYFSKRAEEAGEGGRLVLYGCSDQVLRIFTVAGLADAGIVFDSRDEALAELATIS